GVLAVRGLGDEANIVVGWIASLYRLDTDRIATAVAKPSDEAGSDDGLADICTGAEHKETHRSPTSSPAASNASRQRSSCSLVCVAVGATRSRDIPSGTVGGRMAGASTPRSRSASSSATAFSR